MFCILEPDPFFAVGLYYEHFEPVSNDAVRQLPARNQLRPCRRLKRATYRTAVT